MSTLFAYGQTGSGKTHTVSGLERLVAESLFSGSSELALSGSRRAYVSILELAGKAYDLLNGREPVTILEDASGATHFSGATEHEVPDAETLLSYIEDAAGFRHTEATERNGASSRSHAICKLRLVDSSRGDPEKPHASDGMFFLIDLAGSEVARDRAAHTAERMRETRDINVSLAALKACILARSTGAPYVPYRQNRLTRVLKHVFDPAAESRRCRTVVVACINPSFLDIGATKSTLRYGADLKTAPIAAPVAHVRVPFHPAKPLTWSRTELHQWISENVSKSRRTVLSYWSDSQSTVRPETLAPTETTRKLLALRPTEFIGRCQRTRGVTPLQAKELHAKFWGLHVDSLFEGDVRAINNRKGVMGSGPTAVATATGSAKPPRAPLKQRPTIPVVS